MGTTDVAELRIAVKDELPILADIGRRTFLETFQHDNAPDDMEAYLATAFSLERLGQEIATPDSQTFLLWVDDDAAGYLKLNAGEAQTEARGDDVMEIERIYLLEALKGRGLGRTLMEHALRTARRAGKSKVWLGVWERNVSAIEFYRRSGFEVVGEHVFRIGGDAQRDLIMELVI